MPKTMKAAVVRAFGKPVLHRRRVFRHELPHDRSSMTRWRGRVSEQELARLLQESLRIAHKSGALRLKDLRQVTVDTTVQPKAITFPTDGKLLYRAMVRLGKLARRCGIRLRQSYLRVGKLALMKSQRYAHAKQFRRHRRQVKFLRTEIAAWSSNWLCRRMPSRETTRAWN
jgi:transposase, IS5 family